MVIHNMWHSLAYDFEGYFQLELCSLNNLVQKVRVNHQSLSLPILSKTPLELDHIFEEQFCIYLSRGHLHCCDQSCIFEEFINNHMCFLMALQTVPLNLLAFRCTDVHRVICSLFRPRASTTLLVWLGLCSNWKLNSTGYFCIEFALMPSVGWINDIWSRGISSYSQS